MSKNLIKRILWVIVVSIWFIGMAYVCPIVTDAEFIWSSIAALIYLVGGVHIIKTEPKRYE